MAASWELIPCLVQLRADVDELAPGRDRTSDGTIGDAAHQAETSDHNDDEVGNVPIHDADNKHEVHALDLDDDLRHPDVTMEDIVQHVVIRCRGGAENRLRYVIYNRRLWDYRNGWAPVAYTGPSPHTEHAHFSASYDSDKEASRASWHLEDLVALSADDKTWLTSTINAAVEKRVGDVVTRTDADGNDITDTSNPTIAVSTAVHNLARDLGRARTTLAEIKQAVTAPAPPAS